MLKAMSALYKRTLLFMENFFCYLHFRHRSFSTRTLDQWSFRYDRHLAAPGEWINIHSFPALRTPLIHGCLNEIVLGPKRAADRLHPVFPLFDFLSHFSLLQICNQRAAIKNTQTKIDQDCIHDPQQRADQEHGSHAEEQNTCRLSDDQRQHHNNQ